MALTVDTARINSAGTSMSGTAPSVTEQRDALLGISVQPGSFAEANQLKGKVDGCVQAYVTALTSLRDRLDKAGGDVRSVAQHYDSTEADANRLAGSTP